MGFLIKDFWTINRYDIFMKIHDWFRDLGRDPSFSWLISIFPFFKPYSAISIHAKKSWKLVGGFNPFEKFARQIGSFPQFSGWKIQKSLSCHHPDYIIIHLQQQTGKQATKSPLEPQKPRLFILNTSNPQKVESRWFPWLRHGKLGSYNQLTHPK